MKEFKYDIELLINCVKARPCLWNKSLDVYKEKAERRKAWEEIFNILEPQYEAMPLEEQQLTGEHILNKWTNIRDTFVKSLKHRLGKPRRRYIFYAQLKFLIETVKAEPTSEEQTALPDQSSQDEAKGQDRGEARPYLTQISYEELDRAQVPKKRSRRSERSDGSYTPEIYSSSASHPQRIRKRSKRKVVQAEEKANDDIDFIEVNESTNRDDSSDPRLMNEDEAFFASLLPTVVKYNEDERLEFRIEVLKVIKKIKDQRKWKAFGDTDQTKIEIDE